MSGFKKQVQDDLAAVFLNLDEFADTHTVEYREISVVLDEDKLTERQGGAELAIADSSLLFYAKVEDLPPRRNAGSVLNFDGREYTVDSWTVAQGMATVALSEPRTI